MFISTLRKTQTEKTKNNDKLLKSSKTSAGRHETKAEMSVHTPKQQLPESVVCQNAGPVASSPVCIYM